MVQYYYSLKYGLHSDFTNFSTSGLFLSQDPFLNHCQLSCFLSLLPSGMVLGFALSFIILVLLSSTDELCCRMSCSFGLSDVFSGFHGRHWEGNLRGAMSFPGHTMCFTLACSIGDINFDHSLRMASARFLHCKLTVFPFVLTK